MLIENYIINQNTLAILPARAINYQSIVLENSRMIHVKMPPLQLIKEACFHNWTTYEGRRQAVMYHTNYKQKVPIPIDRKKQIITFPTHSPKDYNCNWIFINAILHIDKHLDHTKTIITFQNGQKLVLQVSPHVIQRQYERALACMTYETSYTYRKIT